MAISNEPNTPRNQLLAALSREEYERLLPYLETVYLPLKQTLYEVNQRIEYVYFPQTSVISLLSVMDNGDALEFGTVGNEGMVGTSVMLETDQVPSLAFSQIPGLASRMRTDVFKREVSPGSQLYSLLQRYLQTLFNQIAQSAACNRLHPIEKRFCRWLLMTHDSAGSDEFVLTQEFLSQMLGVRRAGVSEVASQFQESGFIRYNRGNMTILQRDGLETHACECYAKIRKQFERLAGRN
jgi:CRP-like cAMP-binding protein